MTDWLIICPLACGAWLVVGFVAGAILGQMIKESKGEEA